MSRILVTGASGFVGRALVTALAAEGRSVRAAMRHPADVFPRSVESVAVGDMTRAVDWAQLLKGTDTVVHLAGISHATAAIADSVYDRVNHAATAELAAAARRSNIRRLVFASSIRAQSGPVADRVLRETDLPQPTDAYGRSKLAAEDAVRASGARFTILRPVLVYGTEPKGNLANLLRLANSPWPLPLGAFTNRRSLLARANLVSAIRFTLENEGTEGETYIAADPAPLMLRDLVAALRAGFDRSPRLFSVPATLIERALKASGRTHLWERIGGTLVASPDKLMGAGWKPSVETRAGLAEMAQAASPRKSGTASRRTR